jgi:DNA polymerase-3 subunit delta
MRTEFSPPTRAPRREAKRQALSLSSLSLRESLMGEDGKENEVLFGHKNRQKIEVADVRLLVKSKIESDIFKTIDAISQKNKKQAIFLIHKHLETGDSPHYLLSMINFQFRNLLIIKDLIEKNRPYYAILKISKLHPFVVKKSYQEANKFTFPELKKIYQKIFQVDLDIKTGRVSPEAALDLFLAGI